MSGTTPKPLIVFFLKQPNHPSQTINKLPLNLAPIALFVFRRPEHTRRLLESLTANELASQSRLFIFCDGPRKAEDRAGVAEVRAVIRERQWCQEVEIIERESNRGLANSVIAGVTQLCEEFGRVIVVEDDLILAPGFLNYVNKGLNHFVNSNSVMQISGHMFPVANIQDGNAIFLPFVTSWGWATWQRAWQHFDPTCVTALDELSQTDVRRRFNLDNSYEYSEMLKRQLDGKIDSWAIRWNWSVFKKEGLVLYPRKTLVTNGGFDGSGTHGWRSRSYTKNMAVETSNTEIGMPATEQIDLPEYELVKQFLRKSTHTFAGRIRSILKWFRR